MNDRKTLIIFKSIIFYFLFCLSIIPTAVLIWVIPFLFPVTAFKFCSYWCQFVNAMLTHINGVHVKITGTPADNLEPTLLISNHTGPWETVALIPYIQTDFTYVLKKQLLSWKYNFFALGLSALKPIPISRESNAGDFNIMKVLSWTHFNEKRHVLLFPGGTRKPLSESIHFGAGGLLLGKKLKCRVQAIFIDSEKWARGKIIKDYGLVYPGEIKVVFGPLISVQDMKQFKVKELQKTFSKFYEKQLEIRKGELAEDGENREGMG